jgi:hypothetical protein
MMTVVNVMTTMVGNGKCRSSSRCEHHNEKCEGNLPHAPFISRTLHSSNTIFDVRAYSCTGMALIPRSAAVKRSGSFAFCIARSTTTWTVSPSASSTGSVSGIGRSSR